MKKIFLLVVVAVLGFAQVHAQLNRYLIQLRDKRNNGFTLSNPQAYLSSQALNRRAKFKIPIDSTDMPVTPAYIDSIRRVPGVVVLNSSKWFNQVLIRTTSPAALARIEQFPFVKGSSVIAARIAPGMESTVNRSASKLTLTSMSNSSTSLRTLSDDPFYGRSTAQVQIHRGEYLHDKGFTGSGITIAVLDAGFYGYKQNPGSDSVRKLGLIKGEWDFVDQQASVNEDDTHGWYVFSMMAANRPGMFVGTAPHAGYYLLRTEDPYSEYPVEEQFWAAAAEYADSAGADIISSSLGYSDFDDPRFDHSYAERDGKTSLVTRAANMAFQKGMIVTASAGNSGNRPSELKFVNCPADGDFVLAVGAVDTTGAVASFSSYGPNGAGRIKPDVASVGWNAQFLSIDGTPTSASGTSLSNPNLAGLIACLWQAFPEFSNAEILQAVKASAHLSLSPDTRVGYGIPNFEKAFQQLTKEREQRSLIQVLQDRSLQVFPNPFQNQVSLAVKPEQTGSAVIQIWDVKGRLVFQQNRSVQGGQVQRMDLNLPANLQSGLYYLRFSDGVLIRTVGIVRQ